MALLQSASYVSSVERGATSSCLRPSGSSKWPVPSALPWFQGLHPRHHSSACKCCSDKITVCDSYLLTYVCMYVCMHICMYVGIHACMHVWMSGCTDVWMYVCMHAAPHVFQMAHGSLNRRSVEVCFRTCPTSTSYTMQVGRFQGI